VRKRYLIAYDISDDKRRNAIFQELLANGDHVQFSVFLCQLSSIELATLKGSLKENVNTRQDQIIILDMGPAETDLAARFECLGKAYEPPTRVMVI
jgi:CRISPR-associated protein Cas2